MNAPQQKPHIALIPLVALYSLIAGLLGTAFLITVDLRDHQASQERNRLSAAQNLREQAQHLDETINNTARLAHHLSGMLGLSDLLDQPEQEHESQIVNNLAGLFSSHPHFLNISLIDPDGQERLKLTAQGQVTELQSLNQSRLYAQARLLRPQEIYVSPLSFFESSSGASGIRFKVVARLDADDGRRLGYLSICHNVTSIFTHFRHFTQEPHDESWQFGVLDSHGQALPITPHAAQEDWALISPKLWNTINRETVGSVQGPTGWTGFHQIQPQSIAFVPLTGTETMATLVAHIPANASQWTVAHLLQRHGSTFVTGILLAILVGFLLAALHRSRLRQRLWEKQQSERLSLAGVIFDNTNEALIVTDAKTQIIAANKATVEVTGYSEEDLIGQKPTIWSSGSQGKNFYDDMWRQLNQHGQWQGEIINRHKDGSLFTAWENISAVTDARGEVSHFVAIMTDISHIKDTEQRLERMAYHDPLTGLPNRLLFQNHLEHMTEVGKRDKQHFAVALLDLDNFKVINDSLGHPAGDEMLKSIAQRLNHTARRADLVARLGGDEFAILLPGMENNTGAEQAVRRILDQLNDSLIVAGREIRPQASIGIALFPEDGDTQSDLIKAADAAMYHAKSLRKHSFAFHRPEFNERAVHRMEIEQQLRHALAHNELRLRYQPQLDLASDRIVGVEALLRWQRPGCKLMSAAEFIPIAEESGLINDIGNWVISESCRQAREWLERGLSDLRIAINLSGHQISYSDIRSHLNDCLEEHALIGSSIQIELELTESMLMKEPETIKLLNSFREEGVSLALDDFGTGFSSLGQLRRLPVNRLKIAGEFVRNMTTDDDQLAIVRTIVRLGREMNMTVLAEEVEHPSQRLMLQEIGCHEIQGYLISRAISPKELELRLKANTPEEPRLARSVS